MFFHIVIGFLLCTGRSICSAPMRDNSDILYPPLDTTMAFAPAFTISAAISMQPCSAPPAPSAGMICIITGWDISLLMKVKIGVFLGFGKYIYVLGRLSC